MSRLSLSLGARTLVLGLGLAWSPAFASDDVCDGPVSARTLSQLVSAGDVAFADLNESGFQVARWNAGQAVPCLNEPLSTGQVASYHRLEALAAFLDRDHAQTVMSFKAVLSVAPGYDLPLSLAPDNHPLRVDFEVASGLAAGALVPLPTPTEGSVIVDGTPAEGVPLDRPYVFQYIGANGAVAHSELVRPGMPLPDYPSKAARGARPSGGGGGGLSLNVPLAVTAGAAALASGGLYLAANGKAASFWNTNTPAAQLPDLRRQTNTLQGLSLGAGVVAVGAGAGAVVVGSF